MFLLSSWCCSSLFYADSNPLAHSHTKQYCVITPSLNLFHSHNVSISGTQHLISFNERVIVWFVCVIYWSLSPRVFLLGSLLSWRCLCVWLLLPNESFVLCVCNPYLSIIFIQLSTCDSSAFFLLQSAWTKLAAQSQRNQRYPWIIDNSKIGRRNYFIVYQSNMIMLPLVNQC